MAIVRKDNVIKAVNADSLDTDQKIRVVGIKVVNGANAGTVNLRADGVSGGEVLFTEAVAANEEGYQQVPIYFSRGVYVDAPAACTVYLYCE